MKHSDWKEHVGVKENVEIVKIINTIYGLISTMDHLVNLIYFVGRLIKIENSLHTTIFLLTCSIVIMCYEWAIPLLFLVMALYLLFFNYKNYRYAYSPPNVSENINFIRLLSEFVIATRYVIDQFLVDVVYWQNPK